MSNGKCVVPNKIISMPTFVVLGGSALGASLYPTNVVVGSLVGGLAALVILKYVVK